jgi:Ca2+-binding RTX toxin-like protein
MTTIALQGVQLFFDENGDSSSLSSATVEIVLPPNTSGTFSYSIDGYDDDGVPWINVNDDAIEVRLNGQTLDSVEVSYNVDAFIAQVGWSSGTTTILGLNIAPIGGGNDSDIYLFLDGPVPQANNVADWNAFDDSITSIGAPTGSLAAGQDIPWGTFVNDSIFEDDEIVGTAGDDDLAGGIGDDYFYSSQGNDTYSGGQGDFDQVTYMNGPAGVVVDLQAGTATDGWGDTDTLRSIEMVRGSAYADDITGDRGANHMRGLEGNDTLDGGRGRDMVRYDRDARYGGEDGVTINLKKGFAIDGFGDRDQLSGFERAMGSDANDVILGARKSEDLYGLGGNDRIKGGGGNDNIDGGTGRDKLDGGGGNDVLTGGGGADRFIFRGNFGDDEITDFSTAGKREKIDLRKINEITSFTDLMNNHATENANGDVVIRDDDDNTITLTDISLADLSANDFLF